MISLQSTCFLFVLAFANFIGQTSACSGTEILECVRPVETMTVSQYADPVTVCQTVDQAVKCFESEVSKCPGPAHLLSNIREHFQYLQTMCERGIYQEGKEEETVCSARDIETCVEALSPEKLARLDTSYACLEIHNAVDCVHKEMDTCPPYLQPQINHARQQLEMVKSLCEPNHLPSSPRPSTPKPSSNPSLKSSPVPNKDTTYITTTVCPWSRIQECVYIIDMLYNVNSGFHVDRDVLCRENEKAAACIQNLMVDCPQDVSSHLWTAQLWVEDISMHCRQPMSRKKPESAGHKTDCVQDDTLMECLLHNQMPVMRDGEGRRQSLGRDKICLLVGASQSCMAHRTRNKAMCSPSLMTRMSSQFNEQQAQCKQLGYPTNKAPVASPTSLMTSLTVSVPFILRYFL